MSLPQGVSAMAVPAFRITRGNPPVTVGFVFPFTMNDSKGWSAWVLRYRRLDDLGAGFGSLEDATAEILRQAGQ